MCDSRLNRALAYTQVFTHTPSFIHNFIPARLSDFYRSSRAPGHLIHVFHPIPAQEEVGSLVHKMSILIIEGWAIGLGRGGCKNIATSLQALSKVTFAGTLGSTFCVG